MCYVAKWGFTIEHTVLEYVSLLLTRRYQYGNVKKCKFENAHVSTCLYAEVSGTFTILVTSTVVRTQTAKPFGHYNQSKFNVNRKEPNDRHTPHD